MSQEWVRHRFCSALITPDSLRNFSSSGVADVMKIDAQYEPVSKGRV